MSSDGQTTERVLCRIAVKLQELSAGYAESAQPLRAELKRLRARLRQEDDAAERCRLRHEIAALAEILTQCLALAELTAHYYERGYYRDKSYTL